MFIFKLKLLGLQQIDSGRWGSIQFCDCEFDYYYAM